MGWFGAYLGLVEEPPNDFVVWKTPLSDPKVRPSLRHPYWGGEASKVKLHSLHQALPHLRLLQKLPSLAYY